MGLLRQFQEITENMTARTRREVEKNNKKYLIEKYTKDVQKQVFDYIQKNNNYTDLVINSNVHIFNVILNLNYNYKKFNIKNDVKVEYFRQLGDFKKQKKEIEKAKNEDTEKEIEKILEKTIEKLEKKGYYYIDIFQQLQRIQQAKKIVELVGNSTLQDYFKILNKIKKYYKIEIQLEQLENKINERKQRQLCKQKQKKWLRNRAIDVGIIAFLNNNYKKTHHK